jgi:hypothetical protein
MGLFSVVSRVPKMTMRAGDSRSPSVPLADFVKLLRNCATACRFPICRAQQGPVVVTSGYQCATSIDDTTAADASAASVPAFSGLPLTRVLDSPSTSCR